MMHSGLLPLSRPFSHLTMALTLAAGVFMPDSAAAVDSGGTYQTLYYIPCESYIEHRKEPLNTGNNALDKIYVSGWLTGYNYLTPNTYNIIAKGGVDDVMVWMDDYCAKNLKKNVEAGLLDYTSANYPARLTEFVPPAEESIDPVIGATSSQAGRNESRFMLSRDKKDGVGNAKK